MYLFLKRILDIVFSLTAIVVLSPILIIVMIALKFSGEGEVFYLQKRIGLKNQYFNIYKFATMLRNSLNIGTGSITVRNDPRVTRVGKFLRKSKLNELPQLFNILLGSMSVVGPRPLVDATFNDYSESVRTVIYNAKPGLTGIGSIVFRDEEKWISESDLLPAEFYKTVIAPHKGELELWYLENRSNFVDFKIIILTAFYLFFSESNMVNSFFPTLPKRPVGLLKAVNQSNKSKQW